jgi:hypothetical protein
MMLDMDHVPWIPRREIETKATGVIAEARRTLGTEMRPPIPIEAIIENVFDLHLLVDDLTERYPHLAPGDDLLGATLVTERQILIHEKLLDDSTSSGRYFFTCAHELGHWVLHREHGERPPRPGECSKPDPAILCRLSHGRKRGEWQADYLAACLLMPEAEVREAYRRAVSDKPLLLVNRDSCVCRKGRPLWLEPVLSHAPYFAERVIEEGDFLNVSKAAMCVRLRELGLLINGVNMPWLATA